MIGYWSYWFGNVNDRLYSSAWKSDLVSPVTHCYFRNRLPVVFQLLNFTELPKVIKIIRQVIQESDFDWISGSFERRVGELRWFTEKIDFNKFFTDVRKSIFIKNFNLNFFMQWVLYSFFSNHKINIFIQWYAYLKYWPFCQNAVIYPTLIKHNSELVKFALNISTT